MATIIDGVKTVQIKNAKNGDFDLNLGESDNSNESDVTIINDVKTIQIRNAKNGDFDLNLGGGSDSLLQFEKIGSWTGNLPELNRPEQDVIDTLIDVENSGYPYIFVTIECDGQYSEPNTTYWMGPSIGIAGYNKNVLTVINGGMLTYRGLERTPFKTDDMTAIGNVSAGSTATYGVNIKGGVRTIQISRITHNGMPKIMGGNYTVNVYGLVGIQ